MAFARRLIEVQFELGKGDFGEAGFDQVKLTGHRVAATILKAGGNSMGTAEVQIYGMTLDQMNQLTVINRIGDTSVRRNQITLFAGNEGEPGSLVFTGTVINAFINAQASPNVPFTVSAATGLFDAVKPVPASSFKGVGYVVSMLQGLASLNLKHWQTITSERQSSFKVAKNSNMPWTPHKI